ncbi:MAG: MFS transporter [Burkholderiaceae bacterium]
MLLLLLGASFVLSIRHRAVPAGAARSGAPGLDELTAGIRFIWQRPVMLGAISLDLFAVLLGGATALLPIFAKDILHAGPEALGLLRAAPALGAVVVGVTLARFPLSRRVGAWMLGSVAVYGVSMIGFALSTSIAAAFAALWISGASDMVSVVIRQSLVQLETPDGMRGRVGAVNSVFIGASNQLGEFESGVTAAWLGPVGSVLLGGVGTLMIVAAWWRLFPALAHRNALHQKAVHRAG